MTNNRNFILGNGISGLIWKFYNPEFELIGPQEYIGTTGQQKADQYSRSYMIWLHDCVETRQLLSDLGWTNIETRRARIGYYDKGIIRDQLKPSLQHILVSKKMTPWNIEIKPSELNVSDESRLSMSGQTEHSNYMDVISIDHGSLINKLRRLCPSTPVYAGAISESHIGFTNTIPTPTSGYVVNMYDQIISTIPAPIFYKAWKLKNEDFEVPELKSFPVTFAVTRKKPSQFDGNYEMVYYDDTVPFTRISHLHGKYCIEFTGIITKDEFCKLYPELAGGLFDFWVQPGARIVSESINPPVGNIIFSGRFATWNHKITAEYVIREARYFASVKELNNAA